MVTGAGRGIGAGLAVFLRGRGATVITCDLAPDGVDHVCHVSDAAEVAALFEAAGPIDGLVNNAALLTGRRPYDEIPLDEWDRMMAVNVKGTFLCAKAAAASMGERGGSIVNIASETAFTDALGAYDPTHTPLGRVMMPDDLYGTIAYLLSDDSAFVSGQTLMVNGGRVPN